MINNVRLFSFVLAFSFILIVSPASVLASKKHQKIYRVAAGKVTPIIYRNPTIHSKVIKKLPSNTRWIVKLPGIKVYSNETWLHVVWNNKEGWIKKNAIVLDNKAINKVAKNPKCLRKKTRDESCNAI